MAANTKIEWAEATWNPIMGCTPVSEGCEHCYARAMIRRFGGSNKGFPDSPSDVTMFPPRLLQPFKWRKPRRVFVNSMSDTFHEHIPGWFIWQILAAIAANPQHTFMVLTKRPERLPGLFCGEPEKSISSLRWFLGKLIGKDAYDVDLQWPIPNLWLGVTAENQERADERIPILLQAPAVVHFVSVEPMLGPIRAAKWMNCGCDSPENDYCDPGPWCAGYSAIDWAICGAETGPGARHMDPAWAEDLLSQCRDAGVPFFMKQMSDRAPIPDKLNVREFPEVQ